MHIFIFNIAIFLMDDLNIYIDFINRLTFQAHHTVYYNHSPIISYEEIHLSLVRY